MISVNANASLVAVNVISYIYPYVMHKQHPSNNIMYHEELEQTGQTRVRCSL